MNSERINNTNRPIKCSQPPGGQANFSFNWNPMPNTPTKRVRSRSKTRYNIINNQDFVEKENVNINYIKGGSEDFFDTESKKPSSIKTTYTTGKNNFNIFTNEHAYGTEKKFESIKVTNAPGGKTNINFGNEFFDYRRK